MDKMVELSATLYSNGEKKYIERALQMIDQERLLELIKYFTRNHQNDEKLKINLSFQIREVCYTMKKITKLIHICSYIR